MAPEADYSREVWEIIKDDLPPLEPEEALKRQREAIAKRMADPNYKVQMTNLEDWDDSDPLIR